MNKNYLAKELRLVQGHQLHIISSLCALGVPLKDISFIFNLSNDKIKRIASTVKPTISVYNACNRAVAYSSLDYKVYKVAGAVVITLDENIPPERFKVIPSRTRKEVITKFMENGMFIISKIEDTPYANKTFSQILNEDL